VRGGQSRRDHPIEKTRKLGLWEAKLLRWGEEPSCSGILGKAPSKGVGERRLKPLQSWQVPPPPLCQAVLGEGSAQTEETGRGYWAMTSPFSLHGAQVDAPPFLTFGVLLVGWVGLGFLVFLVFVFVLFLHLAHAGQWSPTRSVPLSGSHALAQGSLSGACMV